MPLLLSNCLGRDVRHRRHHVLCQFKRHLLQCRWPWVKWRRSMLPIGCVVALHIVAVPVHSSPIHRKVAPMRPSVACSGARPGLLQPPFGLPAGWQSCCDSTTGKCACLASSPTLVCSTALTCQQDTKGKSTCHHACKDFLCILSSNPVWLQSFSHRDNNIPLAVLPTGTNVCYCGANTASPVSPHPQPKSLRLAILPTATCPCVFCSA